MGLFGPSKDEIQEQRFHDLLEQAGEIAETACASFHSLKRKRDEREREMQLRLSRKLTKDLATQFKREAGVGGTGTRVDLFGCIQNFDVIISLKKDLSEQKVKNLVGEAAIVGSEWQLTNNAEALVYLAFLFDVKKKNVELGKTLTQALDMVQTAVIHKREGIPMLFHWEGKHAM